MKTLLQTPRLQWYLRHGVQARGVGRSCEHAGWYLHGALTFRQGQGIVDDLSSLNFVVKHLFDDDELTPTLKTFLAVATSGQGESVAEHATAPGAEPVLAEDILKLLDLAQQAVEVADSIPGGVKRYLLNTEQATQLVQTFRAFGRATERFCTGCEEELAPLLKNT